MISGEKFAANTSRIKAIEGFGRELDSHIPSNFTREDLSASTARHAMGMLGLTAIEAEGLRGVLENRMYVPSEQEVDEEPEIAVDLLKCGLIMDYVEEYALLYSQVELRQWIGPFVRTMLAGHTEESTSVEHEHGCTDNRFCPTKVIGRYLKDTLTDIRPTIEGNELYIAYPNEIINMNVSFVRTLQELGRFTGEQADGLISKYRSKIDAIDDDRIFYDERLFL